MGQIVSSDLARSLLPGLKTEFQKQYAMVPQTWDRVATRVDSTLPTETYAWLGQTPSMRQWTDERMPKGLTEFGFTIKNKKWEASLRVDRETLEDEQYGQIKMRVQSLAGRVGLHRNALVWQLLAAGFTNLAYDGSNFFDTTHSEGASGTQVNKGTTALTATTYATARATMMAFKDDQGELNGIMPTLLIVPPALEATARTILNADFIADVNGGGTTNIWKGSSELLVVPQLTDTNDWFLVDATQFLKPLIFQVRKDIEFTALDTPDASDTTFMRDAYFYGVRARYNVGFGDWRTAFGSSV